MNSDSRLRITRLAERLTFRQTAGRSRQLFGSDTCVVKFSRSTEQAKSLIPDFWTATLIVVAVVFVELWAIACVQNRYMETPFWRAALQVVVGGALVFAAGILIGNA
jgi:hypothetical protein